MAYECNSSSPNRYLPNVGNIGRKNDSNNMTIQIGLQCVNQNQPYNLNTLNDITASSPTVPTVVKNSTEQDNSLNNSNLLMASNHFEDTNFKGFPVAPNCNNKNGNSTDVAPKAGNVTLTQEKLQQLTRMAMTGCEVAERLAYAHRNRPCFKKIDSLCARMKQDLIRPDGVLPNINSQGIVWAVKDLIFVFTRIINAWIIIKGYVYNTPDGLNKVKSSLTPDFEKSFAAWQEATMNFTDNLIKSFISLDGLVQNHRNAFPKSDIRVKTSTPVKPSANNSDEVVSKNSSDPYDESFDFLNYSLPPDLVKSSSPLNDNILTSSKSYFSTIIEDSEETQRKATTNGTYFRTGVYNPLRKEDTKDPCESGSAKKEANRISESIDIQSQNGSSDKLIKSIPVNGEGDGNPNNTQWLSMDLKNVDKPGLCSSFDPTIRRPLGFDLTEKLEVLLCRISNLSEGKYFFTTNFTRNYFPDFAAKYPNFMDLRSIILKAQIGSYSNVFEIVHDLKLIVYTAKMYLQCNKNDLLKVSIMEYEKELNNILKEKMFQPLKFDHITGDPTEKLLLYGNY